MGEGGSLFDGVVSKNQLITETAQICEWLSEDVKIFNLPFDKYIFPHRQCQRWSFFNVFEHSLP